MLAITPVLVEPTEVMRQSMHMFDAEFSAADITTSASVHESYNEFLVTWVHCDPSRLTQIIINLLTNAIKFTKTAKKRSIHVELGAATTTPLIRNVHWFPSAQSLEKKALNACRKDEVYITFVISDTGQGQCFATILAHGFLRGVMERPFFLQTCLKPLCSMKGH